MRQVQYTHTFFRVDDESREGSLLTFMFDIPYFPPCSVFPPFHILNLFLARGSGGGGMSPGAIWEPFAITMEEYEELICAIESTPPDDIRLHTRFSFVKPIFDHELDGLQKSYLDWMTAACKKHGARYRDGVIERAERERAKREEPK
jgi:hypothetical protein